MPDLSTREGLVDIPPPAPGLFRHGINHPELWLWDAWTVSSADTLTLFSLSLARQNMKGAAIAPGARNDYPFHVRRFTSRDGGDSWRDHGAFLSPSAAAGGVMAHNVWSGSAVMSEGQLLFGFTGIRRPAAGRSFLQSICVVPVASCDGLPDPSATILISDPEADYQEIVDAGYYLGPRAMLGDDRGEEGGPILAWRDPFLLAKADGDVEAFWAAKTAPTAPAIAHARLSMHHGTLRCRLLPPILLPDSDAFTQAELPKVYRDPAGEGYLMLISACNRLREDQPDDEVSKEMRLYRAAATDGPWHPYRGDDSVIPGIAHLFGGAFAPMVRGARMATLIAPYTEMASPDKQLTFAPPVTIALSEVHGATHKVAI